MTYGSAIAALSAPPPETKIATVNVTIPEGRSRREIVPIAKQAGLRGSYLDASQRFAGVLNPFRYERPQGHALTRGLPLSGDVPARPRSARTRLVDRQLAAFAENFAAVDLARVAPQEPDRI